MVEKKCHVCQSQWVIVVVLRICAWQLGLFFLFAILFWTTQHSISLYRVGYIYSC